MRVRLVAVSLVLCLSASSAFADSLTESVVREATFAAQTRSADPAKIDWQLKIENAQAGEKRGRMLTYVGAGVAGGGLLLATSGRGNCSTAVGSFACGNNDTQLTGGMLILLGGGGLATVGFIKWRSNTNALESLQREGKLKGYVTVVPTRGGVSTFAALSF